MAACVEKCAAGKISRMRDAHMLWIGAPCRACGREDFLPLVCASCTAAFCADHFGAHGCAARDYFAPQCPYCLEPPRGWQRGAPAEHLAGVMERHYGECSALGGAPQKKQTCSYHRCSAVLHFPIQVRRD